MTCNIWVGEMDPFAGYLSYAWPSRFARQTQIWLEQKPDVICLQEAFLPAQWQELQKVPGYTLYTPSMHPIKRAGWVALIVWLLLLCFLPMLIYPQPVLMLVALLILFFVLQNHAFTNMFVSQHNGAAMLIKNTLRVQRVFDWVYAEQDGDFVNNFLYRGGLAIDVELPDATTAQIITTHLNQNHSQYRMTQIKELLSFVNTQADTVVMCGDFNAGPDSPEILYIQEHSDLKRGDNLDNTWNNEMLLDYILTNKPFESYQVLPLRPTLSDHSPLVADI
jgi:endonuclease/exonuclease/phosphatase family metal-dependent hydrolase